MPNTGSNDYRILSLMKFQIYSSSALGINDFSVSFICYYYIAMETERPVLKK